MSRRVSVCRAQPCLKTKEFAPDRKALRPLSFLRCVRPQHRRLRYGRRWRLPERFFSQDSFVPKLDSVLFELLLGFDYDALGWLPQKVSEVVVFLQLLPRL